MNENKNPQITLTKSSSVSEILLENDNNAKEIFKNLKQNLYNVEHWNLVKDKEHCHFQLCNQNGEEKTGKSAYGTGYTDLCHPVYHRRGCGFHAACHRQACRYRRPGCDLPKTPLHGRGAWKVPGIV